MAIRRGRAWGNALGGWRLQGRGPRGRFLPKAGGRSSNYRPSRNQIAAQNQAKQERKVKRNANIKRAAKATAIVGGVVAAGVAANYGLKGVANTQANLFDARMSARFVRNAAAYSRASSGGSSVAKATVMKAGNFPQVRMSPRAPIGLQGFSNASTVTHSVASLLPPVSYHLNTRRPSVYRASGEALRSVQPVNMDGKQLISRADMTKERRAFGAKKSGWKRTANARAKKAAAAAAQNPAPVPAAPAKAPASKSKVKSPTPKSRAVAAPTGQMTIDDIAPVKPATGKGSKTTKASDAKKAATGGGRVAKTSATSSNSLSAAKGDSNDTRLVGSKMVGTDEDGNTISIEVAKLKPKGAPKASNQPKPEEAVNGLNPINLIAPTEGAYKGDKDRPTLNWNQQGIEALVRRNQGKGVTKKQIEATAILKGMDPQAAKQLANEYSRAKTNLKAKERRAVNPTTGKRMSKQDAYAASMAGEVVTKKMSNKEQTARIQDKMASGKMTPDAKLAMDAYEVLKQNGLEKLGSRSLRKEARDSSYTGAERRAMTRYALWLDQKAAAQKKG